MDWLIYDEGEMLLKDEIPGAVDNMMIAHEPGLAYSNNCRGCKNLEILLEAKNETIAILKHQLGINKGH